MVISGERKTSPRSLALNTFNYRFDASVGYDIAWGDTRQPCGSPRPPSGAIPACQWRTAACAGAMPSNPAASLSLSQLHFMPFAQTR